MSNIDNDSLLTVEEFLKRNRIGLTKLYSELGSGRLEAMKVGSRTLISREAEASWRASLPRKAPWPEAQAEARA